MSGDRETLDDALAELGAALRALGREIERLVLPLVERASALLRSR